MTIHHSASQSPKARATKCSLQQHVAQRLQEGRQQAGRERERAVHHAPPCRVHRVRRVRRVSARPTECQARRWRAGPLYVPFAGPRCPPPGRPTKARASAAGPWSVTAGSAPAARAVRHSCSCSRTRWQLTRRMRCCCLGPRPTAHGRSSRSPEEGAAPGFWPRSQKLVRNLPPAAAACSSLQRQDGKKEGRKEGRDGQSRRPSSGRPAARTPGRATPGQGRPRPHSARGSIQRLDVRRGCCLLVAGRWVVAGWLLAGCWLVAGRQADAEAEASAGQAHGSLSDSLAWTRARAGVRASRSSVARGAEGAGAGAGAGGSRSVAGRRKTEDDGAGGSAPSAWTRSGRQRLGSAGSETAARGAARRVPSSCHARAAGARGQRQRAKHATMQ